MIIRTFNRSGVTPSPRTRGESPFSPSPCTQGEGRDEGSARKIFLGDRCGGLQTLTPALSLRTGRGSKRVVALLTCVIGAFALTARADSWIGDAGHFLEFPAEIFANNPEGKAFSVTVHRHIWETDFGNGDETSGQYQVSIVDPAGKEAAAGTIKYLEPKITLQIPAGAKGVYKILYKQGGYGLTWVESTLDQMVVGCGDYNMKNGNQKNFFLHVMAPRRWYFFVPQGVKKFEVKHIIVPFQSHRED
jgi:hypothetical protein